MKFKIKIKPITCEEIEPSKTAMSGKSTLRATKPILLRKRIDSSSSCKNFNKRRKLRKSSRNANS